MDVVTTLSDISASAVAELMTKSVITEGEGTVIREYREILRALGLLQDVGDKTFDELSKVKLCKNLKGLN